MVVSFSTRLSRSPHSLLSRFTSLKALTGCPRNPSGSCMAVFVSESSLSAHLMQEKSRIFTSCLVIREAKDNLHSSCRLARWTWVFTHSLTSSSLFSSCLMYSFSDVTRSFSLYSRSVIWPTRQKVNHQIWNTSDFL